MHAIKLFIHFSGLDDAGGPYYLFWSGIGSGFSIVTLFVVIAARIKQKIEIHHHHYYSKPDENQPVNYKPQDIDY